MSAVHPGGRGNDFDRLRRLKDRVSDEAGNDRLSEAKNSSPRCQVPHQDIGVSLASPVAAGEVRSGSTAIQSPQHDHRAIDLVIRRDGADEGDQWINSDTEPIVAWIS